MKRMEKNGGSVKPGISRVPEKSSGERGKLVKSAETLLALLDSSDRHYAIVSSALERLKESEFNLVIVGQFKRGKAPVRLSRPRGP